MRDAGALEAVVARPYAGYGETELFPKPFDKVAPRGEMVEMPVAVAERRIAVEELARWFEMHSRPRAGNPGGCG